MNKKTHSDMNQAFPEALLTGNDVARVLNVSRAFAYQLMQRGEIPTVHLGRSRRVIPADLERYISQNRFEDQDRYSSVYG